MRSSKSNLQFIINANFEVFTTSLSGVPWVIRDIEDSINEFSAKHPELKIEKTERGFSLSPKAYMAVQHVIYDKIK